MLVGDRRWDWRVWLQQISDFKRVKGPGGQKCRDNGLEMWHLHPPSLAPGRIKSHLALEHLQVPWHLHCHSVHEVFIVAILLQKVHFFKKNIFFQTREETVLIPRWVISNHSRSLSSKEMEVRCHVLFSRHESLTPQSSPRGPQSLCSVSW